MKPSLSKRRWEIPRSGVRDEERPRSPQGVSGTYCGGGAGDNFQKYKNLAQANRAPGCYWKRAVGCYTRNRPYSVQTGAHSLMVSYMIDGFNL